MVIAGFQIQDKLRNAGSFLTLSSADIAFAERELVWRTYTAAEAMPMTRMVKITNKKEFAAAALSEDCTTDEDGKSFMAHTTAIVEPTGVTMLFVYTQQPCTIDKGDDPTSQEA